MKEHIKDYGHYGPHSASDRPRQPGKQILTTEAITARFEEWSVDENGDSQPRRTVQSCEYNSFKTRLWHTDVAAEIFFKGDKAGEGDGHICPVEGCYYLGMGRPEGCERVVFKTMKALLEHRRRAHESGLGPSLAMQVRERKEGVLLARLHQIPTPPERYLSIQTRRMASWRISWVCISVRKIRRYGTKTSLQFLQASVRRVKVSNATASLAVSAR